MLIISVRDNENNRRTRNASEHNATIKKTHAHKDRKEQRIASMWNEQVRVK